MSNRVYAAIFYIALIIGSSWVTVSVGEALTREALTKFALIPSANLRPSRVDTFLAAQDRAMPPQNAKKPLVPTASSLPVGALAKAMDEAEQSGAPEASATRPPQALGDVKPRVAGWSRQLPKRRFSADESTGHIIMRTLRADM